MLNQGIFFVGVWVTTLSGIPLVITAYLLVLLYQHHQQHDFILPSSQGLWRIHREGQVYGQHQESQLTQVDLSLRFIKVSFTLATKETITVWRDSCQDKDYRQLCLVLQQWQAKT